MITRGEWNDVMNDLLLQVKPMKLRVKIGEKILKITEENKILKKAFELACKGINEKYAIPFGNDTQYNKYFIEQSIKILEDEQK